MKPLNRVFSFAVFFASLVGCGINPSVEREKTVIYSASKDVASHFVNKTIWLQEVQTPVPFHGTLNVLPEDSSGSMMYSGGAGAGGFLAQILTHAAIANEAQKNKLAEAQRQADEVLTAYQAYIDRNIQYDMLASAMSTIDIPAVNLRTYDDINSLDNELILESMPTFYLSQNERSIIIDHHVKVFYSQSPDNILFENIAKVISPSIGFNDGTTNNPWLDNGGEKFFNTTKQLYRQSFSLLLKDMYQLLNTSSQQQTYKYNVGTKTYYVRGNLVLESCLSTLIRDLKGNIVDMPNPNQSSC